jgi:hypothetical protein
MSNSFLETMDLFGYEIKMKVKRNQTFRTNFGGLLTISILLTIAYVIWYFGNEIIFKKRPYLITTDYNDSDPLRINLTDSNFMIMVGLTDINSLYYIDESIFTVQLKHNIIIRNTDGSMNVTVSYIPMIPCSGKNISLLPDYFNLLDLKNLYCLKETDFYLQGDFGQVVWSYLELNFKRCQNSTSKNSCKSPAEISKYLDGGYFGMAVSDTNIDATDFNNPSIKYGHNFFTSYSIKAYRDFFMYIKTIQVTSDSGWLMEDIQTQNFFSVETVRETWDFRDTSDIFFTFWLRGSLNRQVFERSYLKVQSLAANVGGIVKFLFICGQLVSYYFKRLKFRDYLTAIFFNDSLEGCRNEIILHDINPSTIHVWKDPSIANNLTAVKRRNFSAKDNKLKMPKYSKFTFCEILSSLIRIRNSKIKYKEELLNKVYSDTEIYFDWVHLVRKLIQVDIMKAYIFDENEQRMLTLSQNIKHDAMEVYFDMILEQII